MDDIRQVLLSLFAVIKFTFREIYRSKIFYQVLLIGLGLILLNFLAYSLAYGEQTRVALNFGLGAISLSSVGMAIFMGHSLIAKEIEYRHVYFILVRPIPRWTYLLGRIGGMCVSLLINILLLAFITYFYINLLDGNVGRLFFWAILFSMAESIIALLVMVFFSLFTNNVISVLVTIVIFILGHAVGVSSNLALFKEYPLLAIYHHILEVILPNFSKLNIKDYVLYQQDISLSYLLSTFSHSILYASMLILMSIYIFQKKELN